MKVLTILGFACFFGGCALTSQNRQCEITAPMVLERISQLEQENVILKIVLQEFMVNAGEPEGI